MATELASRESRIKGIEQHSYDFIPLSERHGKAWAQAPFWFAGGAGLLSATIGFIGPSLGLNLTWSVLAVFLGMAFGTIFMALHANQGPRLGIPQMIQSRAQFGRQGAVIPLTLAVLVYIVLLVFTSVYGRTLFNDLFKVNVGSWFYPPFIALVVVIAVVGHDVVHFFNRWAGYLSVAVFVVMNILLVTYAGAHKVFPAAGSGFSWTAFLVVFAAAAGYQLAYVVYTSDYTRYLPQDVSAPKLIGYVYAGATLGPAWLACLGAVVASFIRSPDPFLSFQQIGNSEWSGFGTFLLAFELPVFVIGVSPVVYGAALDSITAVDSIRSVVPTRLLRVLFALGVGVIGTIVAIILPGNLLTDFSTALSLMLYLLIPWTAVNLVDYYLVRKGKYAVAEILKRNGVYGQWNWRGVGAYALGIASMVPFYELSFYQGPAARALGGADISFAVGIAVAAVSYYLLARGAFAHALEESPGILDAEAPA